MSEKNLQKHSITLDNRKALCITGVTEVESSNETAVKLNTSMGKLFISGSGMAIEKINVETGDFSLVGEVKKIEYKTSSSGGSFSSLFK